MRNAWWAMGGLVLCAVPAQAQLNQQWLEFRNETGTRLQAADGLGAADPEEKDYAWGDVDKDGWTDLVVVRKQPFTTAGKRPGVLFMNENGVLVDRTAQYAVGLRRPGRPGLHDARQQSRRRARGLQQRRLAGLRDGGDDQRRRPQAHLPSAHLHEPGRTRWPVAGLPIRGRPRHQPLFVLNSSGQPTATVCPGRFCSIAAGDVDNDGDLDLYLGDYDAGAEGRAGPEPADINDRLWINDGNGFFTDSHRTRMTAADAALGLLGVGRHRGHQRRRPQRHRQEHGPATTPTQRERRVQPRHRDAVPFDFFQVADHHGALLRLRRRPQQRRPARHGHHRRQPRTTTS